MQKIMMGKTNLDLRLEVMLGMIQGIVLEVILGIMLEVIQGIKLKLMLGIRMGIMWEIMLGTLHIMLGIMMSEIMQGIM